MRLVVRLGSIMLLAIQPNWLGFNHQHFLDLLPCQYQPIVRDRAQTDEDSIKPSEGFRNQRTRSKHRR